MNNGYFAFQAINNLPSIQVLLKIFHAPTLDSVWYEKKKMSIKQMCDFGTQVLCWFLFVYYIVGNFIYTLYYWKNIFENTGKNKSSKSSSSIGTFITI